MAGKVSTRRERPPRAAPRRAAAPGRPSPRRPAARSAEASGRDAAVAALVAAATRLFARAGPDGVGLRAIAAEAGVNYGLIHQYVGSKEDLLRLVLRRVSEEAARNFSSAADLDAALAEMFGDAPSEYVAMLAWAMLQDRDAGALLGRSPALAALAERAGPSPEARGSAGEAGDASAPGGAVDRNVRLAAVTAMSLGWRLFGRFIAAGVGLGDPAAATPALRALARQVLASSESGTTRVTGLSMSPSGRRKRQ